MASLIAHDIVVHYLGKIRRIANVDPNKYSYIELLNDVSETALNALPGNLNLLLHMRCLIPRTDTFMDINDDKSVVEMFKVHENELVINLYVFDIDIIPELEGNVHENENHQAGQQNFGIDNNAISASANSKDDREIYDSSSDESWKQAMESDLEDVLSDEKLSVSSGDNSDINFSDFEENEDAHVVRDSESDDQIDPLKTVMRQKMWTYNPREEIEFHRGQLFTNVDAFRATLKDYAIEKGFPLVRLKNERTRCTAKCGSEDCKWRIHASLVANTTTFMIKTYYPEHTCIMNKKNVEATSDWMASKLVPVMRDHPSISTEGIVAELRKFGVEPNRMQIYRARDKALEVIEGSHTLSYAKLPKYAELVRLTNPGSIVKIHFDRPNLLVEPSFLRFFISFKAQKVGFLTGCRPFIGFDGCHLKGSYGGVLLTAVALDGNNSLFPVAFAIAECENKETWSWFFFFFEQYFGPFANNIALTFMSDRQKGLNLAYEERVPQATARYCCWHIYNNFKLKFPGLLLRRYFWQAAKSFDSVGHNEAMERIKDLNIEAWKYLMNIPKSAWARHAFSTAIKCDHVTNNFTESFNSWVGKLRGKSILTLVEGLRRKMMKKLHKRYQKATTWTTVVTPKVLKKLKDIGKESRKCELIMASEFVFEVGDVDTTYIVKLEEKECDCGAFQLTGLPCKHAALGILYRRETLAKYCDPAFSLENYFKCYSSMIHPIPHEKRWPPMEDVTPKTLLPPPKRKAPGRPRRNRKRGPDEEPASLQTKRSTTLKCSKCGSFGHNKRTCKGQPLTLAKTNTGSASGVSVSREKPGRGIANRGLAGAVLWDHVQGNVPVIVSSHGSNPIPLQQNATLNVQVNLQASTSTAQKKKGRSSKKTRDAVNNVIHDESATPTQGQQNPFGPSTQATQNDGSQLGTSISIGTVATEASHTVSGSFSNWF